MLDSLLKDKSRLKLAGGFLALAASFALVWFTINTPERGRNPLVTAMEKDSALFFATERNITALAQDAKTGAAKSIGLSMPRLRADMKGVAASADVQLVANWMMRNNKHRGHPFIVADKVNSLLFAFDANGALLAKTLALFGAAHSDVMTDEQANKPLEGLLPSDMITPAGLFVAEAYLSPSYGKSVRFAEYAQSNMLIHRAPSAKRLTRLQSPPASNTRITLGCINLLPEFMDNVLMPNFSGESTVVVLPEMQSAKSFFAINDATEPVPKTENVAADKPFIGGFLRLTAELLERETVSGKIVDFGQPVKPVPRRQHTPEEFAVFLQENMARLAKTAREANVKLD